MQVKASNTTKMTRSESQHTGEVKKHMKKHTKNMLHFIKGFITYWTLVKVPSNFISVFLQHAEPLSAQVWRPSAFVEEAAVGPERITVCN